MTHRHFLRRAAVIFMALLLLCPVSIFADEAPVTAADSETDSSGPEWQAEVTFPDWKEYTDDTLAMNSMYSFYGCHGQGTLQVAPSDSVVSFRMYVNGQMIDTSGLLPGKTSVVDISPYTINGRNTLQISNISPSAESAVVTVSIPYPEVLAGSPEDEGIRPEALALISDLVETDIENGFTSAQLAVIRNGRLVYSNAWGKTNTYLPDGSADPDAADVTTDTLYDLASVTKMFTVNYALQKLVTDGQIDLDAKITEFLGDAFSTMTMDPAEEDSPDLDTIKAWKAGLTIRDLLRHQGGFPASPRYYAPLQYTGTDPEPENPYYAGIGADEQTKKATVRMICRTPLIYEPGTKTLYSDVDYMVLGLIVEKVTGTDLDTYLKKTFYEPMGLSHITYNPLKNGFSKEDCAATELNGNTRDGLLDYEGLRTYTLQGEVHDETAWYNMAGISGHAGLFSNAEDLAKLASVMLCGGYGNNRFFSVSVMDLFTAPKKEDADNWGLGWWRQGDDKRVWYFGTQAESGTIGHQGWTGTLIMIDPDRQLAAAYLTNKINSPVTDNQKDANTFNGNWYTAGTLGFVAQILSIGMDQQGDIKEQLLDLTADMAVESMKLVDEDAEVSGDHPSARNLRSKLQLFEKTVSGYDRDAGHASLLREEVNAAYQKTRSDHKERFNDVLLRVILAVPDGGGYYSGREETEEFEQNAWEGMDAAFTMYADDAAAGIDLEKARPSFSTSACYMALLKALSEWDTDAQISREAWIALKPYTVEGGDFPVQDAGAGCWGRANAAGPGMAVLAAQLGAGENTYLAPRDSYDSEEEYFAAWDQLEAGDFLKIFRTENIGNDSGPDIREAGDMVVFLQKAEAVNEAGERDDVIFYWSSNGSGCMPDKGYGIGKVRLSEIVRAVSTRVTYPGAFDNAKELPPDDTDPWLNAITDYQPATEDELIEAIAAK